MAITFTELRQFDDGTANLLMDAITKYNGLIFFSLLNKEVWTYNPITGRFLLNSTFATNRVTDFLVIPATTNSNITENTLWAVTAGTDGKLFLYDNDGTWTEKVDSGDVTCYTMAFYKDNIYYGTEGGEVFKYDGTTQTVSLPSATTGGDDIESIVSFDGTLYAGSSNTTDCVIYKFDGTTWSQEQAIAISGINHIFKFAPYRALLYFGTDATSSQSKLWERSTAGVWTDIKTFTASNAVGSLQEFKDHLYITFGAAGTDNDQIQRYNGSNFIQVKAADTEVTTYGRNAIHVDDNRLYVGSRDTTGDIAKLWELCAECSDDVVISDASPFGWSVGSCDITPALDDVEEGCYCEVANYSDKFKVQIQHIATIAPILRILNNDNGDLIAEYTFVSIIGNIWEVEISLLVIPNPITIVNFEIYSQSGGDAGSDDTWAKKSSGTAADIRGVTVDGIKTIILGSPDTNNSATHYIARSTNSGDTFTDITATVTALVASANWGVGKFIRFGSNSHYLVLRRTGNVSKNVIITTDNLDSAAGGTANFGGQGPLIINVDPTDSDNVLISSTSGAVGALEKSTDGASTFSATTAIPTGAAAGNAVLPNGNFLAGNNASDIYLSTDGGSTWNAQTVPAVWTSGNKELTAMHTFNNDKIIACGDAGHILLSTDGGVNWLQVDGDITVKDLKDITFIDDNIGWACGETGTVLRSTDGGASWATMTTGTTANLLGIASNGNVSGYIVAATGASGELIVLQGENKLLATSECISVRDSHKSGLLIKYTNDTNFTGFDYTNGLVNQIRIIAHFWQPINPQTKSIYEQSTGDITTLKSTVKKGFILETDYMPEYMQRKLSLIFAHTGIEINGVSYYGDEAGIEFEPIKGFRQAKGRITLKQRTLLNENII